MEKFNRWSDLKTGINPFVQPKYKSTSNILVRSGQYSIGAVLSLVRVILFLLVLILYLVLRSLVLVRFLQRPIDYLFCNLMFLILGIFVTKDMANARRLGLVAPGTKPSKSNPPVKARDLIICNHTNFLEVLYLAMMYSPVFVSTTDSDATKGLVSVAGVLGALRQALSLPVSTLNKPVKLSQVIKTSSAPIVVFPEGTRSNGKGVLRFLHVFDDLMPLATSNPFKVHVIGFRYDTKGFNPTHVTGGFVRQTFLLCFYGFHRMNVTTLGSNLTPAFPGTDAAIHRAKDALGNPLPTTVRQWEDRIRTLLSSMIRSKPLELSTEDFKTFTAYWNHVTNGGREPASDFTKRLAPHEHAQWTK